MYYYYLYYWGTTVLNPSMYNSGSGFASSLNPQLTGAPNGNGTSSVPSLVNVGTTDNGAQSNSFSDVSIYIPRRWIAALCTHGHDII